MVIINVLSHGSSKLRGGRCESNKRTVNGHSNVFKFVFKPYLTILVVTYNYAAPIDRMIMNNKVVRMWNEAVVRNVNTHQTPHHTLNLRQDLNPGRSGYVA
jgi:hypothetical protein